MTTSLFELEFRITPGAEWTFVVATRGPDEGLIGKQWGFTDIDDLIEFLKEEAAKLPLGCIKPNKHSKLVGNLS